MKSILSLSKITFKEGIRNRSLLGIGLLSIFLFGLNISVAGFFMRDIGKVSVDMNLSALSFSGLLLLFFVGVNLISKDIDRKTIHVVLSKPISRPGYIIGKYLGILLFVYVALSLLFLLSCLTILLLKSMYLEFFQGFLWLNFFIAYVYILVKCAVLLSLIMLFCSVTTSSLTSLILSVLIYVIGSTIEEVIFYLKTEIAAQEQLISSSLHNAIVVISYVVPNFSVFDYFLEASHGLQISLDRLLISLGYGALYIVIMLALSSLIFMRREFH